MADRKVFANQGPVKPDIRRSGYDLSHGNNMTARLGRIYPNLLYDAPAGSSFKIRAKAAFDLEPLQFPIQSNIRMHQKFYKIPKRILWKNFKDFVGQHGNHVLPYVKRAGDWTATGTLADYMGICSNAVGDAILDALVPVFAGRDWEVHSGSRTKYSKFPIGEMDSQTHLLSQVLPISNGVKVGDAFGFLSQGLVFPIIANTADKYIIYVTVYTKNRSLDYNTDSIKVSYLRWNPLNRGHYQPENELPIIDPCSVVNGGACYNATFTYDSSATSATAAVGKWFYEKKDESTSFEGVECYRQVIGFSLSETMVNHINGFINQFDGLSMGSKNPNRLVFSYAYGQGCVFGDDEFFREFGAETEFHDEKYNTLNLFDFGPIVKGISYRTKTQVDTVKKFYFESIEGADPKLPLSALPFRAYEMVYNYFFRNERVDPFVINNEEVYNKFLTNEEDGADETTPLDFKYAPYEYDLFTTCVKTPQFGNAPLVGITTNNLENQGILHMVPDGGDPYDIGVEIGEDSTIVGITNYEDVADKPSVMRLSEAIQFGISINDLRNVSALQRFQERHMRAGTKYQNIVYEFFGTHPPIGEEFPEYLGGFTSDIYVGKIMNQAKSDNAALGEFAGTATLRKEGRPVKVFCSEDSYILGIIYFTVVPVYPQMLPRLWTKSHLLEFYNPQFANIGLQPVYNHQIAPLQCSEEELTQVFGYNRPFAEYVSMQDEVHGRFREADRDYCVQRVFASKPELNHQFITIDPAEVVNVFSEQNQNDKIKGMVYFKMTALLPIPKFAVPRII